MLRVMLKKNSPLLSNAQAISSLQSELLSIEGDVAELITEMEAAISEADSFLSVMEST